MILNNLDNNLNLSSLVNYVLVLRAILFGEILTTAYPSVYGLLLLWNVLI